MQPRKHESASGLRTAFPCPSPSPTLNRMQIRFNFIAASYRDLFIRSFNSLACSATALIQLTALRNSQRGENRSRYNVDRSCPSELPINYFEPACRCLLRRFPRFRIEGNLKVRLDWTDRAGWRLDSLFLIVLGGPRVPRRCDSINNSRFATSRIEQISGRS